MPPAVDKIPQDDIQKDRISFDSIFLPISGEPESLLLEQDTEALYLSLEQKSDNAIYISNNEPVDIAKPQNLSTVVDSASKWLFQKRQSFMNLTESSFQVKNLLSSKSQPEPSMNVELVRKASVRTVNEQLDWLSGCDDILDEHSINLQDDHSVKEPSINSISEPSIKVEEEPIESVQVYSSIYDSILDLDGIPKPVSLPKSPSQSVHREPFKQPELVRIPVYFIQPDFKKPSKKQKFFKKLLRIFTK